MAEAIRWKNCYGDVVSSKNGWMAQSLLDDVIEPGLDALDAQVSKLEKSEDEALVIFLKSDLDHLHHAVAMGYCLSIQALWEWQIRTYLRWCAKELAPEAMTRTE